MRRVPRRVIRRILEAAIVLIQTVGEFLNWHPYLHVLTATGAFLADGSFAPSPYFDATTLREVFEVELTSAESTAGPPKSETAWLKVRRKS